jgi:hypothetical protein
MPSLKAFITSQSFMKCVNIDIALPILKILMIPNVNDISPYLIPPFKHLFNDTIISIALTCTVPLLSI